ncbi:MAG: FKBP-type peptidyl-prolyl cis-trans isomerase [Actinobacteria bacterium]|nr:FKBP-type peptidyl-prolyl cis-trans isomerase [Actinomycetota bacterium]
MAGRTRDRQRANRQRAAAIAAREAKRRAARRRLILIAVSALLVAGAVVVALLLRNRDSNNDVTAGRDTARRAAASSSTSTTAATASVAGKPCVPVADPLPPGAPAVPVKTGPPPDQLIKEDLKPGTGAEVRPNDTVTANYIGVSCSTGKIFDASYKTGQPVAFPLAQVIPGWLLGIPSGLAYGPQGRPPAILADEALWFVVEVTATKAT